MNSLHNLTDSILSIINNAILIVGPDDRITFANNKAAAMFRTGHVSQLTGQPVTRLFMPDDQEFLAPNLLHLARSATEFEDEVMLLRFDGSRFMALISTSQMQVEGSQNAIFSIHNISGLKGLEKTLRHTERAASLGRMLEDINHQIRNPVSIIGGFASRLAKKAGADNRYTQAIIDEAKRLEDLLDALSAFSALPPPKVGPVTFEALLQKIKAEIIPLAQAADCPLLIRCPEELLATTVSIDPSLIVQAISALVDNAREASAAGCHPVTLEIGSSGKTLPYRISIIDQGGGISPADRDKVFALFFTRKTRHHGMGLTLAQRIVVEQGGEMTVESNYGEGTMVHLFLMAERRRAIRVKRLSTESKVVQEDTLDEKWRHP